ncbi:glycoside hydrolase 5 family protein [Halostella litorea]|uniref:hypothetical protein n=1 Tax=Halostella litorea TaxID=2528831 RepID=UPI001092C9C3|nr:hypothetical protein [Halostella litorea]
MTDEGVSRRWLLAAVGGTGSLAGCSGVLDDAAGTSATSPAEGESTSSPTRDRTATATPQASVEITALEADPAPARQTDTVTVKLTAHNPGPDAFDGQLTLGTAEGVVATKDVSIPAEGTETLAAEREVLRVGERRFEGAVSADGSELARARTSVRVEQSPASFVGVDGTSFALDDGTFYLSGVNPSGEFTFGFGHPHHDRMRPYMFEGLDRVGATVARAFGWNVPVQYGGPFPGEDNAEFFSRFDEVIVRAKRRNVRLAVPIVSGAPSYRTDPEENLAANVPGFVHRSDTAEGINDFYHDEGCIELYKQWVEELLTHENRFTGVEYRDDPTIMLWELGNEVEYLNAWERDSQTIRPWIEEVGPYVKELAGDQLLTTGTHGWPDGRNDFVEDHRPDCIDACSLHWWVGEAHYDLPADEAAALLDEKIAAAHDTLGKPLWFSEYNWGYPGGDSEGIEASFLEERNRKLRQLHDRLDEADVAAAALHELSSKHVLENMAGRTREQESTEVYADADTGTVDELRRYARITREKSTASTVPDLPPDEFRVDRETWQ